MPVLPGSSGLCSCCSSSNTTPVARNSSCLSGIAADDSCPTGACCPTAAGPGVACRPGGRGRRRPGPGPCAAAAAAPAADACVQRPHVCPAHAGQVRSRVGRGLAARVRGPVQAIHRRTKMKMSSGGRSVPQAQPTHVPHRRVGDTRPTGTGGPGSMRRASLNLPWALARVLSGQPHDISHECPHGIHSRFCQTP